MELFAFTLTDPNAGRSFFSHLVFYSAVPTSSSEQPGVFLPFVRVVQKANLLTYGRLRSGYLLVGLVTVVWLLAAVDALRRRGVEGNVERLVLLAAALIPVVWVLILPQHFFIHATFMIRIYVASIALAPLALFWPLGGQSRPREFLDREIGWTTFHRN